MAPRTRRNRRGKVLDVRSPAGVKMFEKLIVSGPLTMVFVKAEWCGACHRFNDEVWSHLTKLKNKNMNLASVDSEMIGKTSLASVPRKFYPTLLLVGKDKKAATFLDEDGSPTNAMPRNNSLSEDKEALTNLVQNPTPPVGSTMNPTTVPNNSTRKNNLLSKPVNNRSNINSVAPSIYKSLGKSNSASATIGQSPFSKNNSVPSIFNTESVANSRTVPLDSLESKENTVFSAPLESRTLENSVEPLESRTLENSVEPLESRNLVNSVTPLELRSLRNSVMPRSQPPDVGSDLIASQTKSVTGTAGVLSTQQKGGRLLNAIRNKTASIRAMLRLRSSMPSFKARNRASRKVRR